MGALFSSITESIQKHSFLFLIRVKQLKNNQLIKNGCFSKPKRYANEGVY